MNNDKVNPFEFETEAQQDSLPTTSTKPPAKRAKSSKSPSFSRKTLLKSLAILFAVAMLGFFIFLLVEFIRDKVDDNKSKEATVIQLNTVSSARSYFETKRQQNSLLKSATWSNDYVTLGFESTTEIVRLSRSLFSKFETNSVVWMAYVIYMDSTDQLIPFLGNSKFFESVDSSDVVLNPNNLCPLVAEVTFTTPVQGKIKLTIAGRDSLSHDLVHQFNELTSSHVVPVIGLYENYNNQITLDFTDTYGNVRASKQMTIQTAAIPSAASYQLDIKQKLDSSSSYYAKGPQFILIFYLYILPAIHDEQGYIRWYLHDSNNLLPSMGSGGRPYIFPLTQGAISFFTPGVAHDATVYVGNMLGKISGSFYVPNGVHHEIIEKTQGGNLLLGSGLAPAGEEVIEEWDRETLTLVKRWNLENYFDKDRSQCYFDFSLVLVSDWMHLNSIEYDPKDNTLLISSRNQCFFGKIGYDDGKVKFIAGYHQNWNSPYSDYLLTPTNFNTSLAADQDYTYFQHTAITRPNGNYIIFDNGGNRPGFTNKPNDDLFALTGKQPFSYYRDIPMPPGDVRAVEYSVDYEKKTITKIWEYTDFPTLSNSALGSVREIDDTHLLIGYGEIGAVSVIDRSNNTKTWHAITPIFYRAYSMDLYAGY